MSDGENRDDGKTGAFLVGFFVGVLVCLAVGGTLFTVQQRRSEERARVMMDLAEQARAEAERAKEQAEAEKAARAKAKE